MTVATFPPEDCVICLALASVVGMEQAKALATLKRVLQQECQCGYYLDVHPTLHPHTMQHTVVGRYGGCDRVEVEHNV